MNRLSRLLLLPAVLASCLTACTPRYDWREIRGADAPYTVLMPVKPVSHVRSINLGGAQVTMTMTAAEVNGALFAVGTATMSDAATAAGALAAMKAALLRNIGGTIKSEKASTANGTTTLDIEAAGDPAVGDPAARNGTLPRPLPLLFAHLVVRDARIYQVVVIGSEKTLPREAVDTFLTSFKLN